MSPKALQQLESIKSRIACHYDWTPRYHQLNHIVRRLQRTEWVVMTTPDTYGGSAGVGVFAAVEDCEKAFLVARDVGGGIVYTYGIFSFELPGMCEFWLIPAKTRDDARRFNLPATVCAAWYVPPAGEVLRLRSAFF